MEVPWTPTQLSQQIVQFLAPFLPYLLKMGEQAAEEAAKKLGAEAWEQAKALWAKLKPKVEAKPAAQEFAAHPEDEDAQAALRLQLRKLLNEDQALAREVQRMLEAPAVRAGHRPGRALRRHRRERKRERHRHRRREQG